MPHRRNMELGAPEWMDDTEPCLRRVLLEAHVARRWAEGGPKTGKREDEAKKLIKSGDSTLERIADGRERGDEACKRAADAVRKFTMAGQLRQQC